MAPREDDGASTTVPLGIPSLDRMLGGGVRPGSSVLAIGPFGSGYREFLKTAATIHGNWQAESGLFDLEYPADAPSRHRPSHVTYLSVTESESRFERTLLNLADREQVTSAVETATHIDFAAEFADLGPVRPAGSDALEYKTEPEEEFRTFFRAFGDTLAESLSDSVVLLGAVPASNPSRTRTSSGPTCSSSPRR